jgi:hypothetical protein
LIGRFVPFTTIHGSATDMERSAVKLWLEIARQTKQREKTASHSRNQRGMKRIKMSDLSTVDR